MKNFIDPKVGFGLIVLSLFFGCSKAEVAEPVDVSTKASEIFYDDGAAAALVASYSYHDSLWHNDLTLQQALDLNITEAQYTKSMTRMENINASLRKAYSEGKEVIFGDSPKNGVSPLAVDGDDRIIALMYITYLRPLAAAEFSSKHYCVRASVSCYPPDHFGFTWANVHLSGKSGDSIPMCGSYYVSGSNGSWYEFNGMIQGHFSGPDDYAMITVVG